MDELNPNIEKVVERKTKLNTIILSVLINDTKQMSRFDIWNFSLLMYLIPFLINAYKKI